MTKMEKKTNNNRSLNDLKEEMRAVARGERNASPLPLNVILKVLAVPENTRLLELIRNHQPASVSELAKLADREQANVSRSLQRLVSIGFIRLSQEGRAVRPVILNAGVNVDFIHNTYEIVSVAA